MEGISIVSKKAENSLDNIFEKPEINNDNYKVAKACEKVAKYLATRFTVNDFHESEQFANEISDIPKGCIPIKLSQLICAFKEVNEDVKIVSNSKKPQRLLVDILTKLQLEMHKVGLEIFGYNTYASNDLGFTSEEKERYYLIRLLYEYEIPNKYGIISLKEGFVRDDAYNVVNMNEVKRGKFVKMSFMYIRNKDGIPIEPMYEEDESGDMELTPFELYVSIENFKKVKRYNEEEIINNLNYVKENLSETNEEARLAILSNLSLDLVEMLGY